MKKIHWLFVFIVFIFGFILRVSYLKSNTLTFGYDQARDAIVSQEILKGDIKIQGPSASTPGLYHGVFYYYLLAPAYLIGEGSPVTVAYWIAFLNSLTVFIVFYLGYLITKKPWAGIISSFLFAVSFEAVQYATWLSNPTIAVWTVPLTYLGLWLWISGKSKFAPIIAALGFGLSVQSEIFLLYHIIPIIIWLVISRKSIDKKGVISFLIMFLLTVSTMILGEFKFGFRSIEGIKALALGGDANLAYAKSIGDYLILYLNQIGRVFAFNLYPGNIGWGGGAVIALALYSFYKKDKVGMFLSTWLFSHIWVVSVGGVSTPFLMVGIGPAVSLTVAYCLSKIKSVFPVLLILAVIVFGNISMLLKENPKGSTLFSIQKDMLLSKQLSLIDYTYENAEGESFSINSLTSPLWINIVWSYLYKWYGLPKYGYIPSFHGRDQIGQIDALDQIELPEKTSYLILEPMAGIPSEYLEMTIGEEDTKTKVVDEVYFGELRVQKRAGQ